MSDKLKHPLAVAIFAGLTSAIAQAVQEGKLTEEVQNFLADKSFDVTHALLMGLEVTNFGPAPMKLEAGNDYAWLVDEMLSTQVEGTILDENV